MSNNNNQYQGGGAGGSNRRNNNNNQWQGQQQGYTYPPQQPGQYYQPGQPMPGQQPAAGYYPPPQGYQQQGYYQGAPQPQQGYPGQQGSAGGLSASAATWTPSAAAPSWQPGAGYGAVAGGGGAGYGNVAGAGLMAPPQGYHGAGYPPQQQQAPQPAPQQTYQPPAPAKTSTPVDRSSFKPRAPGKTLVIGGGGGGGGGGGKTLVIGADGGAKKQESKAAKPDAGAPTDKAEEILQEAMTHESALNEAAESLDNLKVKEAPMPTAAPETALKLEVDEKTLAEAEAEAKAEAEAAAKAKLKAETKPTRHINLVFIGHVDAGKSTISGHIMYLTGMLDDRTLEKFERDAKAKNRESWKYAWAMDVTDTERNKGKTEEVGKAAFKTENKNFTILDAPGHKGFIPHMIGGASQADVGILVISARRGEFEAGFDRNGQTREHALLAKTAGVKRLIVVVNKMDDPTVNWSQERYDQVQTELSPFLKQVGYNVKKEVTFLPVSGLGGQNLKEKVSPDECAWYDGPPLLTLLDQLKPLERLFNIPARLPIIDKYRDMGTVVHGKLESGTISQGEKMVVMPNKTPVEVLNIYIDTFEIEQAEPGDNVRLRLKGVEEDELHAGFVLCPIDDPCHVVRKFDAQIIILETESIMCAGYTCVLHIHSAEEDVTLLSLLAKVDKKTKKVSEKRPKFVRQGETVIARIGCAKAICVEPFKEFQQLGRFMLRDRGKTIGVGVIQKLYEL